MKSKKTKQESVAPKGKVKIKNLKLAKETVENLGDQDAGAIRGGRANGSVATNACG